LIILGLVLYQVEIWNVCVHCVCWFYTMIVFLYGNSDFSLILIINLFSFVTPTLDGKGWLFSQIIMCRSLILHLLEGTSISNFPCVVLKCLLLISNSCFLCVLTMKYRIYLRLVFSEKLVVLDLSSNELSGPIPSKIAETIEKLRGITCLLIMLAAYQICFFFFCCYLVILS